MIYNIEIKDLVREKINNISDYIYRFSFSKEIATKVYNEIYKEIFSPKIFPNRYPKFNEKNMNVVISRMFSSSEDYIENF